MLSFQINLHYCDIIKAGDFSGRCLGFYNGKMAYQFPDDISREAILHNSKIAPEKIGDFAGYYLLTLPDGRRAKYKVFIEK